MATGVAQQLGNPAMRRQLAAMGEALTHAQRDVSRRITSVSASYRAAERHRLSDSRVLSGMAGSTAGTADSHLRPGDREELIARSRDADRNYPVARGLIDQHVDIIAGDGFRPTPKTGNDQADKAIAELWHEWAQECEVTGRFDYDGMTEAAVRHVALDGSAVINPIGDEVDEDGEVIPGGEVQILGGQRLQSPHGSWDTLHWRGGVRVDKFGRPLELNIAEWQQDGRSVRKTSGKPLKILPGYHSPFVLAHSRTEDQYVGEPLLAPVLEDIGQLHDLIESVHQAAHMAALMAFVHKTNAADGTQNMMGAEQDQDDLGRTRSIAPVGTAGVYTLGMGESLEAVQGAQPTQNYGDMVRLHLRMIGAALCIPLELAMLDFSQSNFHGALAAIEVAMRRAKRRQKWLVAQMHRRLYRWKVGQWADEGKLGEAAESMRPRDLYRVDWRYPAPLVVDPKRSAEIFTMLRKQGAGALRDLDPDWEALLRQVSAEQQMAMGLGIVVEGTPGAANRSEAASIDTGTAPTTDEEYADAPEPRLVGVEETERIVEEEAPTAEPTEASDKVQDLALNGAQVASLEGILQKVSDGEQSPEVAIDLILAAFPSLGDELVRRMVGNAAKFKTTKPQPAQGDGEHAGDAAA